MVSRDRHRLLSQLGDTDDTILAGDQDLRGRRVVDNDGNELGRVDDLVVDPRDHTVRLFRVKHDGVWGFGSSAIFLPVEAISRADRNRIWVNLVTHDEHTSVDDVDTVESDHGPDRFGEEGNPPFPLPGGLGPAYPPTPEPVAEPGENHDRPGLRRPGHPESTR